MTVSIQLNGKRRELPPGSTIKSLLADGRLREELGLGKAENGPWYAVAVNRRLVSRDSHGIHALADGDDVEILTPRQGG